MPTKQQVTLEIGDEIEATYRRKSQEYTVTYLHTKTPYSPMKGSKSKSKGIIAIMTSLTKPQQRLMAELDENRIGLAGSIAQLDKPETDSQTVNRSKAVSALLKMGFIKKVPKQPRTFLLNPKIWIPSGKHIFQIVDTWNETPPLEHQLPYPVQYHKKRKQ